jgi:hypothetical protein
MLFDLTKLGLEPTLYRIRGEHCQNYTTDEEY